MDRQIPFSKVAESWVEAKEQLVKRSTYCAYSLIIKSHLLPTFKNHSEITECEAQQFVIDKLNSGLKRKTVKDIIATSEPIVRYGEKYFGFPGERWEIVLPTDTDSKALPTLSITHHRKLLRHLLESPTVQNIGVTIALTTGMRIGEVCALRWENTDLVHRVITVRQTVGRIYDSEHNRTERITSTPKTKTSNREIPIGKELYDALRVIKGKLLQRITLSEEANLPKSHVHIVSIFCACLSVWTSLGLYFTVFAIHSLQDVSNVCAITRQ